MSLFRSVSPVFICILLTASLAGAGDFLAETRRESPLKKNNNNSQVYQLQETFRNIYELYKDSVVFISTEKTVKMRYGHPFMEDPFFREFFGERFSEPRESSRKSKGLGTGFVISRDGYICSNHHVIHQMDSVTVTVSGKEYEAKVVGSDPITDIALLKITGREEFTPVYFGDSDTVRIGDMSVAIGNPFGLDKTITTGIISATGRRSVDQMGIDHIQTDASINPGNSGGPLINLDGEVIGVNRMIYSRTGGNLGIGFAIPINEAKKTLYELKKHGKVKRGYIGVHISPLTEEFAKELGLKKPEGALVGAVIDGSPAEKAGLKVKDVIIKVNEKPVKDFRDLVGEVSKTPIGKNIRVTVWRDKKEVNFWVPVAERPAE